MSMPKNVAEGAELLDKVNPGWFKRINLNTLNMKSPYNCVLGQLYSSYSEGLTELFGCKNPEDISYIQVYGSPVDNSLWIAEIQKRLKGPTLNFFEALTAMNEGKQICYQDSIYYKQSEHIHVRHVNKTSSIEVTRLFELWDLKFTLYQPNPTFGELKIGDKFNTANGVVVWTKVEPLNGVNAITSNRLHSFDKDREVILVKGNS